MDRERINPDEIEKILFQEGMLIDFIEHHEALHCIVNEAGYFVYVNQAWVNAMGYSKNQMYNRRLLEFVHEDDKERTRNAYLTILKEAFINKYITIEDKIITLKWSKYTYSFKKFTMCSAQIIPNE